MRLLALISLLSVALPACAPGPTRRPAPDAERFVGVTHPPLPAGLEDLGGYVIDPAASFDDVIGHIRDARGEMLWLERITSRDAEGQPTYHVVAVQRLPPRQDGEELSLGLCYVEGRMPAPDGTISGVAVREEAEVFRTIRHAWRVDVRARRFEVIPPEGVRCINEAAGL